MTASVVENYEIGRLYVGQFRDLLEDAKFKGHDITYREGSGWLSKNFSVRCSPATHQAIIKVLKQAALEDA